jgi:hypothetical protein
MALSGMVLTESGFDLVAIAQGGERILLQPSLTGLL